MEYQVPQYIEVEDKVVGPFTLKQFIFVAGGSGLCIVLVLYLPLVLGIILALPVAALTGALAFYKINNKSFLDIIEAGFRFYISDRLYLWKKDKPMQTSAQKDAAAVPAEKPAAPGLSRGKLQELAWSLDIKDTTPSQTP